MTEAKRIQLEDLDREELLELFKRVELLRPRQHDILFAKWSVTSARATAALDKVIEHGRTLIALAKEVEAKTIGTIGHRRAWDRYLAARQEERRLDETRNRIERKADRLYAQMEGTPRDLY
jgi:hypothetical protein